MTYEQRVQVDLKAPEIWRPTIAAHALVITDGAKALAALRAHKENTDG